MSKLTSLECRKIVNGLQQLRGCLTRRKVTETRSDSLTNLNPPSALVHQWSWRWQPVPTVGTWFQRQQRRLCSQGIVLIWFYLTGSFPLFCLTQNSTRLNSNTALKNDKSQMNKPLLPSIKKNSRDKQQTCQKPGRKSWTVRCFGEKRTFEKFPCIRRDIQMYNMRRIKTHPQKRL